MTIKSLFLRETSTILSHLYRVLSKDTLVSPLLILGLAMESEPDQSTDFAQDDLSDGREPGEWQTRYPSHARKAIHNEAFYIGILFFFSPLLLSLFWLRAFGSWLVLTEAQNLVFTKYAFAWTSGMFGGSLFAMKWLYHSVAHNKWNQDRFLWRIFAPHLSAGLAFAFIVIIESDLLKIFDSKALNNRSVVFSISFLVGYFSDSALAKLSDLAYSLFGTSKDFKKRSM
jgi:hypothetical protein